MGFGSAGRAVHAGAYPHIRKRAGPVQSHFRRVGAVPDGQSAVGWPGFLWGTGTRQDHFTDRRGSGTTDVFCGAGGDARLSGSADALCQRGYRIGHQPDANHLGACGCTRPAGRHRLLQQALQARATTPSGQASAASCRPTFHGSRKSAAPAEREDHSSGWCR